jgi:hypothetical protein
MKKKKKMQECLIKYVKEIAFVASLLQRSNNLKSIGDKYYWRRKMESTRKNRYSISNATRVNEKRSKRETKQSANVKYKVWLM